MRNDENRYTEERENDLDAMAGVFASAAIGALVYLVTFTLWSLMQ